MRDPVRSDREIWMQYIRGELPQEVTEQLEELMMRDETVFAGYMDVLDSMDGEQSLPRLQNEDAFTARILEQLAHSPVDGRMKKSAEGTDRHSSRTWRMNYVIAAAATLLLLGGGVFDLMSEHMESMTNKTDSSPSLGRQWVDRADHWMEDLKEERMER